ncbi:hypothetical protein [Halostagnicola larsenii]|uniref:hypothetical protein n=1 Tax=Halostagnicola larsenii TaxID=353800 RepID=UPI000A9F9EB7|nr:hypothetical protein [Halostagnicola larsenii]
MADLTRSTDSPHDTPEEPATPDISVCRSSPEKTVFLETGNTDGWITSDTIVDVPR